MILSSYKKIIFLCMYCGNNNLMINKAQTDAKSNLNTAKSRPAQVINTAASSLSSLSLSFDLLRLPPIISRSRSLSPCLSGCGRVRAKSRRFGALRLLSLYLV